MIMAKAEVRYLFNSGFIVQTGKRCLIFDYYNPRRLGKSGGLNEGVVSPKELSGMDVTVFASHAHMDHFSPSILRWEKDLPDIRYVLSDDIRLASRPVNLTTVRPNGTYEPGGGLKIRTLKSTDEGVAFVVEAPELKLYHAGDLNWWHWAGEPDNENEAMAAAYKAEIDKLRGETFDIAFVPVDPRLGKEYLWGLDYFMRRADARAVFPMHFGNHYEIFDRLNDDPMAKEYRGRVVVITRRGERFEV
jgi:L-ascorbate metabolism protein UlaG (beta-lactamase superfamily)